MGTASVEVDVDVEVKMCDICGFPEDRHNFVHAFSLRGEGLRVKKDDDRGDQANKGDPDSQGSIGVALRGDPVLRLALIRREVITADDLSQIEAELRASGIAGSGQ
jgi:hypothetical protein